MTELGSESDQPNGLGMLIGAAAAKQRRRADMGGVIPLSEAVAATECAVGGGLFRQVVIVP